MSFLGFGARGNQPNKLGSIQVQTSEYGVPIPYAGGTVKLPIKLLDYVDFQAKGQTSGGKGGGNLTSYEYFAAIDAGICLGPIGGIGNIYDAGGASSTSLSTETYTIPSSGGTFTSYWNTTENDEGVTYAASSSFTANDYGSDGSATVTQTQQIPMQKVGTSPGAGQYSVAQDNNVTSTSQGVVTGSGGNLHYTFSAADAGKTVTISYTYTTNSTNYVSPAAHYGFAIAQGVLAGTVWGYMEANHPERAIAYPGIARVLASSFDLGSSATPPNVSVEVLNARGLAFGGGIADADPAALITDICADSIAGMAWPYLGDLGAATNFPSSFSNFCVANNLFQSVGYDSQGKALQRLKEITDLANSDAVWSGGMLKIIPYGDSTAVANGRTYTPDTQPKYAIDLGDLVVKGAQEPIVTSWKGLSDNYNVLQFQFTQRDDNYNTDVINAMDEASILMHGQLPMQTVTGDNYRVREYAAVAADMLLKRNSVALRNYAFTLKWFYWRLEPMDIITLTPKGGRAVRIVSITENPDYTLSVLAEDFLYGVGTGVLYPKQGTGGNTGSGTAAPGNTQLLAAFQPNTRLTGGGSALWLALTGGPNWGGCNVYLSTDGSTYSQIGQQKGSSRAGTLTAPLAAGSDPDIADSISVSVAGALAGGSQADADSFATLSLVGQELVSYQTATLTGTSGGFNAYDLGTYLRRGIFANNAQAHAAGEIFVRLDDSLLKYAVDPTLIGKTVYLKMTSFNLLGQQEQDIATVAAIPVVIGAASSASNMAVGSFLNPDGVSATVDVYRQGGTANQSGSVTLPNGAVLTLPAQAWTAEQPSQFYGVNYNPAASAYVLYTSPQQWLADQQTMISIGSTKTPATGSSSGGGGGSSSPSTPGSFADTGASPTVNPAGAYTAGQTATVSSSASYSSASSSGGGSEDPGSPGLRVG